jgi:hypothetical protein
MENEQNKSECGNSACKRCDPVERSFSILNRFSRVAILIFSFYCLYLASLRIEGVLYLVNAMENHLLPDNVIDGVLGLFSFYLGLFLLAISVHSYLNSHAASFLRPLYIYGGWTPVEIHLMDRIRGLFDSVSLLDDNYRHLSGKDPSVTLEDIQALRQLLLEFETEYKDVMGIEIL